MPSYDAGTASVRIRPNADDFVRQLRQQLAAVRDPGFSVTVDADITAATRETGDWRQREERDAVDLDVDADVSGASAQMARWRRAEESESLGIDVDVDTAGASGHMQTWRAAQQTQALQIRVDVDTSALQRLGGVSGGFGGGGGRGGGLLASLIPVAGAGVLASLPALGSIVANLTQGITQLAGAGLVIPGVIGGIASTAITAKVGFTGMADALEAVNQAADGTPESLQAAEDALGRLAPAAADAVKAVAELQPEWERAVRETFQQNMFAGLDDNVKETFRSLLPTVESGLGDISTAWNGTFRELLSVAGSDNTRGLLTRIFGNTADSQRIASGAIDPLTSAIGTLTAAGAESLPRLAWDLDSVATRLDNWVGSAAADGRLDEWIGRGITGFENLGNTVINLGGFIGGVASVTDGDLLASLERVTAKWDEWVNSDEGQESLKQFIADGDELLSSLGTTASNLGPELKAAFDLSATSVGALVTSIEGITTALKTVENTLPGFTESFKNALAGPLGMVNQLKSVLDNNPLASDLAQGKLDAALAAARGNDPRTRPVLAPTSPAGGPAIAAPVPQGPGLRPTRAPAAAGSWEQLLVPSRAEGGPVSTTGPAMLHGTPAAPEFVQRAAAVKRYGVPFMAALNRGDIHLGSFEGGGLVDEFGNPVNPSGPAPGPTVGTTGPIAPNPTAGGGGLGGIFSQVLSGLQGPINNAMALANAAPGIMQSVPGAAGVPGAVDPGLQTQHGLGTLAAPPSVAATGSSLFGLTGPTQAGTPMGNMASRAATIPGFAGLFGSMASPDPVGNLTQWGSNSLQYLANWGMDTIGKVGGTLWQGALGFFGLENSILSPSNVYNQALASTGQFALDGNGPLGVLLGAAGGQSSQAGLAGGLDSLTAEQVQQIAAQNGGLPPGMELPKGVGSEKGLQINTIRAKRAISAAFPGIAKIGGYREDAKKWHPNGLAIDVMIPGWDTPEGKAYGDKIYAYVMANKNALGVDYVMWQEKDHYDHLHVNTTGGGYPDKGTQFTMPGQLPAMDTGGPTPSSPGPVDAKGGHLAVVHPNEFMISARGRASVPDGFLHKLNKGLVDPKELGSYYPGGPIAAAGVRPLPLPTPPPVQARTMNPVAPPRAAMPAPAAPPVAAAAPTPGPTAAPVAPTPSAPTGDPNAPVSTPTTTGGAQIAAAPSSTNHNLDAVNTLISSSASNLGQLASTALSIAAMGAGASGVPGAGAIGAIGPFVAGGIQQGGKIVEGAVNVVSSSLVGNVPGSFGGEPGASPYGRTVRPEQDAPVTSPIRNTTYNVSGNYELRRAMEQLELRESVSAQADLAHHK